MDIITVLLIGYTPIQNKKFKLKKKNVHTHMGFPGGSAVENPSAVQETLVQSLGQEDLLEKELAIHSSILAWRIPWTEEPGGLQSMGSQRARQP